MTFRFNGIGTTLAGDRWLNENEYDDISQNKNFNKILKKLPIENEEDQFRFRIGVCKIFCVND